MYYALLAHYFSSEGHVLLGPMRLRLLKKKLIVLFGVALVSMATIFATTSYSSEQKKLFSFDTQVGYAFNALQFDYDDGSIKLSQGNITFGKKVTYHTSSLVDFVGALNFNLVVNGEYLMGLIVNTSVKL